MARLTENDIAEIKKVYAETGSYAETARRLHRSAATVKKYVSGEAPSPVKKKKDADLICFEDISKQLLEDGPIEPLPVDQIKLPDNFKSWTILTDAERAAMNLNYISKYKESE